MAEEKKILIPGRLKNAAVGGHVAGTEDIYDDILEKDQQVINAETDEKITTQSNALLQETSNRISGDNILQAQIDAGIRDADGLVFDIVPTKESANPVLSNGIYESKKEILESMIATRISSYNNNSWPTYDYSFTGLGIGDNLSPEATSDAFGKIYSGGSNLRMYIYSVTKGTIIHTTAGVLSSASSIYAYRLGFLPSLPSEVTSENLVGLTLDYVESYRVSAGNDIDINILVPYNGYLIRYYYSPSNTWDSTKVTCAIYPPLQVRDTDDAPTPDSTNFVTSGGVYGAIKNMVKSDNSTSDSDLDITDEDGNVLARFQNGGIQTKNFDSKRVNEKIDKVPSLSNDSTSDSDLDITDEDGNVLARFQNGGIQTKNFKSEIFAKRPNAGYENFLYDVDVSLTPNSNNITAALIDEKIIMKDRGIISLPINYKPNGEPVRLVIANQGSSGRVLSTTTKPYHCVPDADLLLAEGFAILQINGTPGYTEGIATYGAAGNPDYLRSIIKAYEYVITKYNIARDGVMLAGFSQGTLKCWQIAANKVIPIKACVMFGPCLDLWKCMYVYCTPSHKQFMTEKFGFVEKEANDYVLDVFSETYSIGDVVEVPTFSAEKSLPTVYELAYILNNYERWIGYNPICWGTTKNIIGEQFSIVTRMQDNNPLENALYKNIGNIVPCPLMMFVGTADLTTPVKMTEWYKGMAEFSAQFCHVRYYDGGTHSYHNSYPSVVCSTKFGGEITSNIPSAEGLLFLERYI